MSDREEFLEKLFDAAMEHGTIADPEMEIGDLQGLLTEAVNLMTEDQLEQFKTSFSVESLLAESAELVEMEEMVTLDGLSEDDHPFSEEDVEDD